MDDDLVYKCDKLSNIQPHDEWWLYQCASGVPEDITEVNSEEDIKNTLSHLQTIFDNKWYVKHGNIKNGCICAGLLLGGMQNNTGNIMRLASNLAGLGGIAKLGKQVKNNLRSITKCRDTILELEILSCFEEEGFEVTPYPLLDNGKIPDGKVVVGNAKIFVEITHNEWPKPADFPGLNWKLKQGSKIIEKCMSEIEQLPKGECGVVILNPPFMIDSEIGTIILESMRDFLLPDVYTRISGVILSNKLIERSGFIKTFPIVLVNLHAVKRCDNELERLAIALWKHPSNPAII